MNDKYHVLYKAVIKTEGFTADEFKAVNDELLASTDFGAADALFIVSVMKSDSGNRSYAFPSLDGTTGEEISVDDLFRIWAAMAHALSENSELGYGRKELCRQVHETVKAAILRATSESDTIKQSE